MSRQKRGPGPWRVAVEGDGYRIDRRQLPRGGLGLRLVRDGVVRLHACGTNAYRAWSLLAIEAARQVREGLVADGDGRLDPVEDETP